VDTAGSVYVIEDYDTRVLKLAAGSSAPVALPFTGLQWSEGVAVDTAGNVYVADTNNRRVLKLPAGSNTQVVLPFTDLHDADGVAVDTAGNVYITDVSPGGKHSRVLKLPAG